jgi:hypothetical protein
MVVKSAVLVRVALAVAALFALSACGPPGKSVEPVAADAASTRSARYFEPPSPDRARVVVVSGQTLRSTGLGGSYIALHDQPGDIYVNDTKIGTLNPREAMVFELAPGAYTFRWTAFQSGADGLKRSRPSVHNLNGGGVLALSTWYDSGLFVDQRYEIQTVSRDPRNLNNPPKDPANSRVALKEGFMIVRPSSCPPALCK